MATNVMSRAKARRGLIFVLLAGILWGTSGVATKTIYSLVSINPMTVAAFRLTLGAPLLLLAYFWTTGQRGLRVARSDLALLLLLGAAVGLSQAGYFAAIARVGVAIATLVTICTAPVLVALFSAALLHERLTAAVGGALVCALLGTILLIGLETANPGSQANGTVSGILLALGAALCFAGFILVSRLLANRYHPLHSIALALSIGGLLLLVILAVTTGVTVQYSGATWALFLYLGLVPTALAYGLFFHGITSATAAEASIAALTEPLTSTILALVIFGERLGALGLLGAALLIGAIVFLYHNGPSAR